MLGDGSQPDKFQRRLRKAFKARNAFVADSKLKKIMKKVRDIEFSQSCSVILPKSSVFTNERVFLNMSQMPEQLNPALEVSSISFIHLSCLNDFSSANSIA